MFGYNYLCFLTLLKKEVLRFLKVGIQTIIGPAISSLCIQTLESVDTINGIDLAFYHGLIMMTMLQN